MKKEKILKGFIEPVIKSTDYFLGQGNLPRKIYQEKGDWTDALPLFEKQDNATFDTINCTGFNTLNQIELYEYKAFKERNNYSDRWLGIISGTTAQGNDPSNVYEAIRKYGIIPEEMLPWTDDIKNIDEYYSFKGADKEACYRAGREWLAKKDFLHQWIFDRFAPQDEKVNNMRIALKYSPIALAVYAWAKNDRGQYIRQGNDVHWTVCYCIEDVFKIFDSYDPFLKELVINFNFYFTKRISITKKEPITKEQSYWFVEIIRNLWQAVFAIEKKVDILVQEKKPVTPVAVPVVEPLQPTLREQIIEYAKKSIGHDLSPKNLAPQELSCAEGVSAILHDILPEFPEGVVSTVDLVQALRRNKKFRTTLSPKAGCIIVSPRIGEQAGHTGIFITDNRIVSNDSNKGTMQDNYSWQSWITYFKTIKSLKIYLFETI